MYVLGPGGVIINKNVKSSYSCKCIFPSAIKGLSFLLSLSLGIQCDRIYEEQPTVSNVEDSANSKVDSTNPANVHEHMEAEIEIDVEEDLEVIEDEPEYDNTPTDNNYMPETDTDTGEETDEDDSTIKGPR